MLLEMHLLIEVTADKSGERPGVRKHSEGKASPRTPLTGSGLTRHHPSSQGNMGCEDDSMSLGPGQVPAWLIGERTTDILHPQGQAFPQHIITSFMCHREGLGNTTSVTVPQSGLHQLLPRLLFPTNSIKAY